MICFLMSLATTIPIAFLESNYFRPLSDLFSGGKDPNVLFQGWMDRSDEFQAPEYKRLWSAHVLKAYMVCAYKLGVHLEVWRL